MKSYNINLRNNKVIIINENLKYEEFINLAYHDMLGTTIFPDINCDELDYLVGHLKRNLNFYELINYSDANDSVIENIIENINNFIIKKIYRENDDILKKSQIKDFCNIEF